MSEINPAKIMETARLGIRSAPVGMMGNALLIPKTNAFHKNWPKICSVFRRPHRATTGGNGEEERGSHGCVRGQDCRIRDRSRMHLNICVVALTRLTHLLKICISPNNHDRNVTPISRTKLRSDGQLRQCSRGGTDQQDCWQTQCGRGRWW